MTTAGGMWMQKDTARMMLYSCGCRVSGGRVITDCHSQVGPCARRYFDAEDEGRPVLAYRCCDHCAPMCSSRYTGHPVECREICLDGKQLLKLGT